MTAVGVSRSPGRIRMGTEYRRHGAVSILAPALHDVIPYRLVEM